MRLNVIAGRVRFSIDLRAKSDVMLERGETEVRMLLAGVAGRREISVTITRTESLPALPMDAGVCDALRRGARTVGARLPDIASGALHDAAILAPLIPTAMLFVASEGGISHNPKEVLPHRRHHAGGEDSRRGGAGMSTGPISLKDLKHAGPRQLRGRLWRVL